MLTFYNAPYEHFDVEILSSTLTYDGVGSICTASNCYQKLNIIDVGVTVYWDCRSGCFDSVGEVCSYSLTGCLICNSSCALANSNDIIASDEIGGDDGSYSNSESSCASESEGSCTQSNSATGQSNSNVRAIFVIVVSVVGGIAGMAIMTTVIFWCCRAIKRNRRR